MIEKKAYTFKVKQAVKLLQNSHEALLFSSTQDILWITGLKISEGYVLITKKKQYLVVDNRYYQWAKNEAKQMDVILFKSFNDLNKIIVLNKISAIRVSSEYTTLLQLNLFKTIITNINQFSSYDLRSIKTNDEIKLMQKAAGIAVSAIDYIKKNLKISMTEIQAKNLIFKFMLDQGASDASFSLIVAFGENSAIPHHQATNRKLQKGDNIKCDIGCIYQGYCSDITRTFWLDQPKNEIKKIYEIVLLSNQAGIKAAKAGITGKQIDQVCRDIITKAGYGEYFIHGTGHGLGIDIHENPHIKAFNVDKLAVNNVVTIEPGIYIPGIGGVRIEDSIVITKTAPIVLTQKAKK